MTTPKRLRQKKMTTPKRRCQKRWPLQNCAVKKDDHSKTASSKKNDHAKTAASKKNDHAKTASPKRPASYIFASRVTGRTTVKKSLSPLEPGLHRFIMHCWQRFRCYEQQSVKGRLWLSGRSLGITWIISSPHLQQCCGRMMTIYNITSLPRTVTPPFKRKSPSYKGYVIHQCDEDLFLTYDTCHGIDSQSKLSSCSQTKVKRLD